MNPLRLFAQAFCIALATTAPVAADTIVGWDFTVAPFTTPSQMAFSNGGLATLGDIGVGTINGAAAGGAVWSVGDLAGDPVFRANGLDSGDYVEFLVDAAGYENLGFQFDHQSGLGGALGNLDVTYGIVGGATFVGPTFAVGNTFTTSSAALSDPATAGEEIFVRLTAGSFFNSTDLRLDNVLITGDLISSTAVPEPSTFAAFLLLGGVVALRRSRKRSGCQPE